MQACFLCMHGCLALFGWSLLIMRSYPHFLVYFCPLHWYVYLQLSSVVYTVCSSGGARALKLGGTISCRRREVSRGVRGEAPPGKFCNRESLKRNFLGSPGNFDVNSQDFEAT